MKTSLEHLLLHSPKNELEAHIRINPPAFNRVLKLALTNNPPLSWRAAWMVWTCMEEQDPRVAKHTVRLIERVRESAEGQQRELLNILAKLKLSEEEEGLLYDTCIRIWEQNSHIPSVRYAAFRIVHRIAQKYPELMHELILLTEPDYTDTLSPAIRKAVLKLMSK